MWPQPEQSLQGAGRQQGGVRDRWTYLFSPHQVLSTTHTRLSPKTPPRPRPRSLLWPCSAAHSFVRTRWETISEAQQMLTHTWARYHPEQTTSVLFEGHRRRGSRKENILKLHKSRIVISVIPIKWNDFVMNTASSSTMSQHNVSTKALNRKTGHREEVLCSRSSF